MNTLRKSFLKCIAVTVIAIGGVGSFIFEKKHKKLAKGVKDHF